MKTKEMLVIVQEVEERNSKREQEWREQQKAEKPLLRMLCVDVYNNKILFINIKDDLSEFYIRLRCNTIDIARRSIGGRSYEVICDDDALFQPDRRISAFSKSGDVQFVGNLLICTYAGNGELGGLSDADIHHLMNHVRYLYNPVTGSRRPVMFNVEYC